MPDRGAVPEPRASLISSLPDWVYRVLKLSPWHHHADRERWERRTYPCDRLWCFRRSPAWRSFSRGGKSWCDKHVPPQPLDVTITVDSVVTGGYSAPAACYCGFLDWTIQAYGRLSHKHGCPARVDAWCQQHPRGCP